MPAAAADVLDVPFAKVSAFLADRRLMANDWRARLAALKHALDTMAAPSASHDACYLRAIALRDEAAAQPGGRGVLGGYAGKAKKFQAVVKAFEKSGVHAGEAIVELDQLVGFDIPYLKTQVNRHNAAAADLDKKAAELTKAAAAAAVTAQKAFEEAGIDAPAAAPAPPPTEAQVLQKLESKVKRELPAALANVARLVLDERVYDAAQYYAKFTKDVHDADVSLEALSALRDAAAAAGASATSAAPEQLCQPDWSVDEEAAAAAAAAAEPVLDLDLGDLDLGGGGGGADQLEIDFDIDLSVDDATAADTGDATGGEAPVDIKWDIDVGGDGDGVQVIDDNDDDVVIVESSDAEAGNPAADGTPAAMLARNDDNLRVKLACDLTELASFLATRARESTAATAASLESALATRLSSEAQASGAHAAPAMHADAVQAALDALSGGTCRDLLLIKTSRRYAKRLASALTAQGGQEKRLLTQSEDAQDRRRDALSRREEAREKLAAAQKRGSERQVFLEKAIASMLASITRSGANVTVRLVGEIRTALESAS